MSNDITDNTFFEVQAEKFYQKKVEVARGVIELGQILIDTKKKMTRPEFLKWLEDNRVSFQERTANKYITIAKEFGEDFGHGRTLLDNLSLNKLYTLASAPEEVKEEVANSKDKEEVEKKIKKYEEQLKQEKQDKEVSSINPYSDIVIKRERKPIPETIKKSVRVRSRNSCERCGYNFTKFPIEEFHHINENPSDNRLDNILHLCPNCHALEHYILRGGILK